MMNAENINSAQHFDDILSENTQVLVDFWAPWCGPCKSMAPTFEEVAETEKDKTKSIKVNIDDFPELAQRFGIRSIPSLIFLKEKAVKSELIGGASRTDILTWLHQQ
jgi:thioredoxin 1